MKPTTSLENGYNIYSNNEIKGTEITLPTKQGIKHHVRNSINGSCLFKA